MPALPVSLPAQKLRGTASKARSSGISDLERGLSAHDARFRHLAAATSPLRPLRWLHPRNRRRGPHPTRLEVRLRPVAAHRAAPRPSTRRTSGFVTGSAGGVPCPSRCLPSRGSAPAGRAGPRRSARTGRAGSPQARVFPGLRARVSR